MDHVQDGRIRSATYKTTPPSSSVAVAAAADDDDDDDDDGPPSVSGVYNRPTLFPGRMA